MVIIFLQVSIILFLVVYYKCVANSSLWPIWSYNIGPYVALPF